MGKKLNKREAALSVQNGDAVHIWYSRPVKVAASKREAMKEKFGTDEAVKCTEFLFIYDERNYFRQVLETCGIHLNPIKEEEYEHIGGALYRKGDAEYFRFAVPEKRLTTYTTYLVNNKPVSFEDIREYVIKTECPEYKSDNRQHTAEAAGQTPEQYILFFNLNMERIQEIHIDTAYAPALPKEEPTARPKVKAAARRPIHKKRVKK